MRSILSSIRPAGGLSSGGRTFPRQHFGGEWDHAQRDYGWWENLPAGWRVSIKREQRSLWPKLTPEIRKQYQTFMEQHGVTVKHVVWEKK